MGRGRQKAKQRKVARQLKYYSPDADYSALEAELAGNARGGNSDSGKSSDSHDPYEDDEYLADSWSRR